MKVQNYGDNVTIPENAAPTVLAGRYRVVRQLGQGGMGSVWLAEDLDFNKEKVAIKMLPSILVKNKRAAKQLKEEALHWKKLSHPNIATMRNYVENEGNPFLVVDYIEGTTLEDYLVEKGKLGEGDAIRLLKPIADALDYAHRVGVIHRDVKPANIMIRKDGCPFVLDFGIAREMHETMTRVTGALSSGTLMYMSPEQLHGADPSPKQDIYAFAAMTYECLTGAPPFNRGQIEYQIEHDMPKKLDRKIAISSFVMSGLAKDASCRPSSCMAILGGKTDSFRNAVFAFLHSTFKVLPWIVGGLLLMSVAVALIKFANRESGSNARHKDVTPEVVSDVDYAHVMPVVTQVVERIVEKVERQTPEIHTIVTTQYGDHIGDKKIMAEEADEEDLATDEDDAEEEVRQSDLTEEISKDFATSFRCHVCNSAYSRRRCDCNKCEYRDCSLGIAAMKVHASTCRVCGGTGKLTHSHPSPLPIGRRSGLGYGGAGNASYQNSQVRIQMPCQGCGGTGHAPCDKCSGLGWLFCCRGCGRECCFNSILNTFGQNNMGFRVGGEGNPFVNWNMPSATRQMLWELQRQNLQQRTKGLPRQVPTQNSYPGYF